MANWKAKGKKTTNATSIDWDYVNSQVKTGLVGGRISGLVDFGVQAGESMIDESGDTYFESEQEADQFIDKLLENENLERRVRELNLEDFDTYNELYKLPFKIVKDTWVIPESQGSDNVSYFKREKFAQAEYERAVELLEDKISKGGNKAEYGNKELKFIKKKGIEKKLNMVKVNGSLFTPPEANEVGIWVDSTENPIEYVQGSGETRPYRSELFSSYKGNVSGLKLITDKTTGCFKNKKLLEVITACDQSNIVEPNHEDESDLSLLVGAPLKLNMVNEKDYIKVKSLIKCEEGSNVPELTVEPICVGFEDEPEDIVEQFKRFYLRGVIIDKIKKASNYEGSNMQKAIEMWEEEKAGNTSNDNESKVSGNDVKTHDTNTETEPDKPSKEAEEEWDEDDDVPF